MSHNPYNNDQHIASAMSGLQSIYCLVAGVLISWASLFSCFPLYADPTIFQLVPSHRKDCWRSDDCCILITSKYFDGLPLSAWDRKLQYPVESQASMGDRRSFMNLNASQRRKKLLKSCRFRCRDTMIGFTKSFDKRVTLPMLFSFECPEGQLMILYYEPSRNPMKGSQRKITKCKCVESTIVVHQGHKHDEPAMPTAFERQQAAYIPAGEIDCIDIDLTPFAPGGFEHMSLAILATTSSAFDTMPMERQIMHSYDVLNPSSIPWTQITDMSQQSTVHQAGSSAQINNADMGHQYRACSEAPEVTAARLLTRSWWTPI